MTSKNLFFKLLREDAKKRLWVIALSVITFFFTFPIFITLMISRYSERVLHNYDDIAAGEAYLNGAILKNFLLEMASAENGFIVFLMCAFSILCAVSGFTYLHSKKKTDFFHSLPCRREKLFAVPFLGGILYTAVPYFIFLFLAALIIQIKTGLALPWGQILSGYLVHMSFYLLMYAIVTVAVILTGNTIVSLLGTIVFFAWGPSTAGLIFSYYQEYFRTYYYHNSPLMEFFMRTSPISFYVTSVEMSDKLALNAALAAVIAVLLTLFAVFLYKKRPSESAGRAMAFKKSQAAIKFLMVVPSALFGCLFMRQMQNSIGWTIFGLICGLLFSYCVIEIIYNFDFRRLFSHKLQLITCAVAAFGILAFFQFDLSGYDSYIPSVDKIKSVAMVGNRLDGNAAQMYRTQIRLESYSGEERHYLRWDYGDDEMILDDMNLTETQPILTIAQEGVKTAKLQEAVYDSYRYDLLSDVEYSGVVIKYVLKGGKEVYRRYFVDYAALEDAFASVYQTQEYKEAVYPILKESEENISGINYQEYGEFRKVNLDSSVKDKLLQTYREELLKLTFSVRKEESPIAAIQFKTNEMQAVIDLLKEEGDTYEYLRFNEWYYYPIYPSFTKTIGLLKECGIDAGRFLNAGNVEKIELVSDNYWDRSKYEKTDEVTAETVYQEDKESTLIIREPEQIEAILKASVSSTLTGYNALNKKYDNIRINVFVPNDKLNKDNVSDDELSDVENSAVSTASYEDKAGSESAEYQTYQIYLLINKAPAFVKESLNAKFD